MSGFLSRWSRRKRGLEQAPPEEEAAAGTPPQLQPEALQPDVLPEFDLASLPSLESLGAGSDLSVFLHPRVPALLRSAALRRVWAADPGIRDFCGPADYAWDYNAVDGVPGFSLDLGTGNLKQLLAQAIGEQPAPHEEDSPPGEDTPAGEELPPEEAMPPEDEAPPLLAQAEPAAETPLEQPPEPPVPSPVRLSMPGHALPPPPDPALPPPATLVARRHGGAMPRLS